MAGDDKDKDRGRRKKGRDGGGRDSGPGVKDVIIERPKQDASGGYEVPLSFLVVWGNSPPRETVNCQILVAGAPRGHPKTVRHDGKVYERPVLQGEDVVGLSVKLSWRGDQTRVIFLGDIELPKKRRKLDVVATQKTPNALLIILRRVGKDGKVEPGPISFWDFEPDTEGNLRWDLFTIEVEAGSDHILATRPIIESQRKVTFFLPDDKETQASVNIPGLRTEETKPIERKSLFQAIAESYRKGRGKSA